MLSQLYLVVLGREVQSGPFLGRQAVVAPPAGTSPAAREALVVDVVHGAYEGHLGLVPEVVHHSAGRVAVLRASGHVGVAEPAGIHLLLHGEVEHGLLLPVVDAGDAGQVGLLVISLQVLDDVHGQVLQPGGHVAAEELLAVHHYLGHVLAVYLHVAVVVNLGSGQLLHQLFEHGSLGGAVGRGVVLQRVLHDLHLRGLAHDHRFAQQHGIRLHLQRAHLLRTRGGGEPEGKVTALVAHVGHLQQIVAHLGTRQDKGTVGRGGHARHKRAVGQSQQLHTGLDYRLAGVVYHTARHRPSLGRLRKCGQCCHAKQHEHHNLSFHLSFVISSMFVWSVNRRPYPPPGGGGKFACLTWQAGKGLTGRRALGMLNYPYASARDGLPPRTGWRRRRRKTEATPSSLPVPEPPPRDFPLRPYPRRAARPVRRWLPDGDWRKL